MYVFSKDYENIPMGNMLAYAAESLHSRHLYGAFNSIGIKSIGRYGIGYYVGYFIFLSEINNRDEDEI